MSSPWVLGQRWHPRPSQPLHPTRCWSSTGTNITPVTKALGRIFGRDSALLECLTGTKSWPNSSVSWRQELQPHAGRSAGPGKWTRLVVSKPWRWLASLSGAVNFQEQPLLTPTQLAHLTPPPPPHCQQHPPQVLRGAVAHLAAAQQAQFTLVPVGEPCRC